MPIYEYECQDCGTRFEKLVRSVQGAEQIVCPGCQSESVVRQISAFAMARSSPGVSDSLPTGPTCATGLCGL